jgi:hypothetical protein
LTKTGFRAGDENQEYSEKNTLSKKSLPKESIDTKMNQ